MLRALPTAGLFVAAVLAGCLGAGDEANDLADEPGLAAIDLTHALDAGTPLAVAFPEGYGGFFVSYEMAIQGTNTAATLTANPPAGDPLVVATFATTGRTAAAAREGWSLLPPLVGNWTLEAKVSGPGTLAGVTNVTLLPAAAPLANVTGSGDNRVVIAVVDTGVNPYHAAFQRPNLTTDRLPARIVEATDSAPPLSVPLLRGDDYVASVRESAAVWSLVPPRTLVHFSGTNLLGFELDETKLPAIPVLDRSSHGTMVSSSATRENPDVLIVMITGSDYDAGVEWAAAQPWVDLISLSWGPSFNAVGALNGLPDPVDSGFVPNYRTHDATREAWRAGKLIFTASGNDPTPTFTDTTSGPPWAHAVAGSLPGGRATFSGNFVDTVADWTQELALYNSLDETTVASGTSFATPTTAGIASLALHRVRHAVGHDGGIVDGALVSGDLMVRNADLRNALNMSAVWWATTDFAQASDAPGDVWPVLPGAPWISQGWGHLGPDAVPLVVQGLLGAEPLPTKPSEAHAWMDAQMALRERQWA